MKSLDIRSESAVKLLSEFLDMDQPYVEGDTHPNAEHFAHGMFSFPRPLFIVVDFASAPKKCTRIYGLLFVICTYMTRWFR